MDAEVPLPSRLDVAGLAWDAVWAATAEATAIAGGAPRLDPERIAVAYSSERWIRLDGERPTAFAPLSGFFRAADGWVRTHGNYPHHAAALREALGLPEDADAEAAGGVLLQWPARDASAAIADAGGLCVPVLAEEPERDAALREHPLVVTTRLGSAPPRPLPGGPSEAPLRGIRVLDLTRVIAGPVGTRTLALLGADVLRIDSPRMPEIPWQHLDTGHGKRSALLDLAVAADRTVFVDLLAQADVIALGYRSAALDRLGLTPAAIAEHRPGVVVVRHSAWGDADRRGFDSLVQAASGIARIESRDADATPGALPAQGLDHSAGYLLAAGALAALRRRGEEGGSWLVETSLRRIAAELLGRPRTGQPSPQVAIEHPRRHVQSFDVDGVAVTTTAPAVAYAGGPASFAAPRPWGGDPAAWLAP